MGPIPHPQLERAWLDRRAGADRGQIAPLIGAQPHEVIVADSVTVNIFKLLTAAAALAPERRVILSEAGNFHTDLHVASGAADLLGMELRVVERGASEAAIGPDVALLLLTHVHYKAGYRFDMARSPRAPRRPARGWSGTSATASGRCRSSSTSTGRSSRSAAATNI
jgi:kynureninase